jgi:hypothetical protein
MPAMDMFNDWIYPVGLTVTTLATLAVLFL